MKLLSLSYWQHKHITQGLARRSTLILCFTKTESRAMTALLSYCITARRSKDGHNNGCIETRDPLPSFVWSRVRLRWRDEWMNDHRWRSLWLLVCFYQICGLVWRQGEGQGGCCFYPNPPPPATNTTSTVLWPVSFFTIDSSLNNHYSQLDKKWVESAGPLIPDQYLTITYQWAHLRDLFV